MEDRLKPGRFLKVHMVDEYANRFKDSSALIVTEFAGITNKELEGLRKKLKAASARYIVVKNPLCRLGLKEVKMGDIVELIDGSCGVSYGSGDPLSVSKVLVEFARTNRNFKLKGGYIEGEVVTVETIKELASIPPKEVLITQLICCINAPILGFVSACSNIVKKLLYALNEIVHKKGE